MEEKWREEQGRDLRYSGPESFLYDMLNKIRQLDEY